MGLNIGRLPIRAAMLCDTCGGIAIADVPNVLTTGTQEGRIILRVDVLSRRLCECCGQHSPFTVLQEYDDDRDEDN